MKENNDFKIGGSSESKFEMLNLIKDNATFFNFCVNTDDGNKADCEKIDNAKKTLDSIYHVYEEVNKYEKSNTLKVNSESNQIADNSTDRIVMPGTDYHGDRRSFQAGVISELVTWKKDVISVMDVTDGEVLFTGTVDKIKANISEIKNKLEKKNKDHQIKVKEKVKKIIICGIATHLQKKLKCDSCDCEVVQDEKVKITINGGQETFKKEIFKDKNTKSISIEFDINRVVDILVDIKTSDQQKQGRLCDYFGKAKFYDVLDDIVCTAMHKFLAQFFRISKQQKVALVHDFEFNKDFNPEKQKVILLGDYIDKGDGSCEILCMISNIQKRISESDDEHFKNNKDCFVAISGNHESDCLWKADFKQINVVCNAENSRYANDLAKKMMAEGQLVSGHVIASNADNEFFSFSHTYIIKTDCYLIMRQIFQLEDLLKNINNEVWINNDSNKNEFVQSTRETYGNKINNYGKKILQLLAKRYETVKNSNKYVGVLQKVDNNSLTIQEKLEQHEVAIFQNKKVLTEGKQFYDDLKNILSDKDFFELRYLAMDTLVYPIAASIDEKLDLCLDSISNYNYEVPLKFMLSNAYLAFSDFFGGFAYAPDCLKSVLRIVDEEKYGKYSLNCLNWQRFFELPESIIIPDSKQVVGHDAVRKQKHEFVVFHSRIIGIDILQSAGYNYKNKTSYVNKTFINTGSIAESYTNTYTVNSINSAKPDLYECDFRNDIFNGENLGYKLLLEPELEPMTEKTFSKKWVSIILELLLIVIGLLLTLFGYMQILGIILLVFGTIGLFVSTFFHDKIANWICNLYFKCCGISTDQIYTDQIYEERKNFDLETDNKSPKILTIHNESKIYNH